MAYEEKLNELLQKIGLSRQQVEDQNLELQLERFDQFRRDVLDPLRCSDLTPVYTVHQKISDGGAHE